MNTDAPTTETLSTGPFLLSAWSDRTPEPGDRRTLTRAWFVTPKDEYGLTRHCGPVAHHLSDDEGYEETTAPLEWCCNTPPVLQIEQVTEEWHQPGREGAWIPTPQLGVITLCERHARIFLGDAKYDALPWPGGQVTFTPAPVPAPAPKLKRGRR
jgi:hypothetical protein